ncbi:MAG TPA: MFS transporter [Candidatus Limnocylindria bacterium]
MNVRATLAQVLANPSLRRLQLAWLIGIAAEKAYLVALLVYAYEVGDVLAVGVFTLLASLPSAVFGPILSSVFESFRPARVLLGLHLGRAAVVGLAAAAIALDLGFGLLVAAAIIEGILTRQHTAFTRALLPALARTPDELIAGNAVTSLGEAAGSLVGPAVAGALLVVGGPVLGLEVTALAYLVAALLVLTLHVATVARPAAESVMATLRDTLGGFGALVSHPSAGLLVSLFISQVVVRGALTVLLVSAAFDLLGIGQSGVGYLNAAIGAGGLVGALLAMSVLVGRRLSVSFVVSLATWGAPIAIIGLVPNPALAFAMAGLIGAANASIDVAGYTLLARCVPNEVRGRVFGVLQSMVGFGIALGAVLAPILVELVGLQAALVITGLVLPVLALAGYPGVRRAEGAAVLPERELAAMRRMPMFAPLPLTALELMARSLVPVSLGTGERVITQGEPGDCFYLIESGEVAIIHDGHREATLGPGDGFGEIALLGDRPRTASVDVTKPLVGYRLPREAFLEALTGSPSSQVAAGELASQRLAELQH